MDIQRFILFAFSQGETMRLGEAVELGELFGKSPSSVRGCVSRLARLGLLTRIASGRNTAEYALSPRGKRLAAEVIDRFKHLHSIVENRDHWDGTWTLISFNIPEKMRERRDRLREGLKELGFGQASAGVWIAPRDKSESVSLLASRLGVVHDIIVSLTRDIRMGGFPVAERVGEIWPLDALNRKCKVMGQKMEVRIKKVRKAVESGRPPGAREAFLELFTVFSEAAELVSHDPSLPRELLPRDWLGLYVQDLIHEHFHLIHGLETGDAYAYLLRLPDELDIPRPARPHRRNRS